MPILKLDAWRFQESDQGRGEKNTLCRQFSLIFVCLFIGNAESCARHRDHEDISSHRDGHLLSSEQVQQSHPGTCRCMAMRRDIEALLINVFNLRRHIGHEANAVARVPATQKPHSLIGF